MEKNLSSQNLVLIFWISKWFFLHVKMYKVPGKEPAHSYNLRTKKLCLWHFLCVSQLITLSWDLDSLWAWLPPGEMWANNVFIFHLFFLLTTSPISASGLDQDNVKWKRVTFRKDFFSSSMSLGSLCWVTL